MEIENIRAIKNGKNIEYLKFCVECGTWFVAKRYNALACSDRCRQRIKRRKHANQPFLVTGKELKETDLKRFKFDKGNVTIIE